MDGLAPERGAHAIAGCARLPVLFAACCAGRPCPHAGCFAAENKLGTDSCLGKPLRLGPLTTPAAEGEAEGIRRREKSETLRNYIPLISLGGVEGRRSVSPIDKLRIWLPGPGSNQRPTG